MPAQLRLPIQAKPVNRYDFPVPFLESVGPFSIIPEVDPQPDVHSYFASDVDQRSAICSMLSSYAVASCLRMARWR